MTNATVQIRSIWLKLYLEKKQETKFFIMGLSPSGCMFSFSLYLIRHKFRIAGLGFFFHLLLKLQKCLWHWCGARFAGGYCSPCTSSPHGMACGEGETCDWSDWGSDPFIIGPGKSRTRAVSGPGPSPVGYAGLGQIWWALTDAASPRHHRSEALWCREGLCWGQFGPAGSVAAGAEGWGSW